jgi:hypothetical protein
VILLLSLVLGIGLGLACGGSLGGLQNLRLRGEPVLVILLFSQMLLPFVPASGASARALYWIWALTFPMIAAICVANLRVPGMALASVGLALNAAVILVNFGMPVLPGAVSAAGGSVAVLKEMDFAHVVGTARTLLPALADVVPIPGPTGFRGVASAGDIVLSCGVAVCISRAMAGRVRVVGRSPAGSVIPLEK